MKVALLSTAFSLASLFAWTAAFVSLDPFPEVVHVGGTYTLSWTGSANYTYTLWLVIATAAENQYTWKKVSSLATDLMFDSLIGSYAWTVPSNMSNMGSYGLWLDGFTYPFDGTSFYNMTEYFAISSVPAPMSSANVSPTHTATASTSSSATSSVTSSGSSSSPTGDNWQGPPSVVHHNSLSGGAIAGIVIGFLALFALFAVGAVLFRKRRKVLAKREREAAARANRLAPVMQGSDPSYEMQNSKGSAVHKEIAV